MLFLMLTWTLLFLCMISSYLAENDGVFECGAHGRFEYCIDGIPGCVIGCHCHPGYYFDTETKICEPNTKLRLNYRRHYMPEPTRVQNSAFLSDMAETESLPIPTTHNIIDEHVNDITKHADDLGDWLYNQFFKTIENQVINQTNKDNVLTRRSGRGSLPKRNKLKRKARRKGNMHKKKKKGLKGKLLRIAEDDSLFQSSESSDSDSSSGSSIQSESSFESGSDEDHGHKKIVLINKKPRPPLPSFIFLPNMNTPFYPPIGLPPPPVMPMYPMVPVPPMMPPPPLMPFPGQIPECEESTTNKQQQTKESTIVQTESPTTSTIKVTNTAPTSTTIGSVTTTTAETATLSSTPPSIRSYYKGRNRKKIKSVENVADDEDELPLDIYKPTRGARMKLLKLLRHKMTKPQNNGLPFNNKKKQFDKYMSQLVPPDTLIDNDITDDPVVPIKDKHSSQGNFENTSELDNVDFKYLSQLIHRVNETQLQEEPKHEFKVQDSSRAIVSGKWSKNRYRPPNVPLDSGRRINQYINTTRNYPTDDSYYSNLGKQIATLIRTIDADKERQFNVEIEKGQTKTNDHPYFNENGPRTFWERSVRSPLRFFHSFKNRLDNVQNSNELLFNIESKVETVASTQPTLSLQELENLINVMQTARTQFQRNNNIKDTKRLTKTLNVNLWPQEVKQSQKTITNSYSPKVSTEEKKLYNYINNSRPPILQAKPNNTGISNTSPLTNTAKLLKINDDYIKRGQIQPTSRNRTKLYLQPIHLLKDRKPLYSPEKRWHTMNPTILNYKNIKKYFFDNNNQYSFQNDELGLQYSPASRASKQQIKTFISSPLFHHEINHVDYIS